MPGRPAGNGRGNDMKLELLREQAFVAGAWIDASGAERLGVFDPATGDRIGSVPNLGAAETRDAIRAAHQAMPEWMKRTARERSTVLRQIYDLVLQHRDALAGILTSAQGQSIDEQ